MNPISNQELLFHSPPNFPGLAHLNSDNHPSGTQNNLARKRRQPRSGFLWFLSTLWAHGHLRGRATRIRLCGPVRQHQLSRPVCDSVQEPRWCLILWVLKRHLQRPKRSPSQRWQSKRGLGLDGEYFLAKQILCLCHHQLVGGGISKQNDLRGGGGDGIYAVTGALAGCANNKQTHTYVQRRKRACRVEQAVAMETS